MNGLLDDFGNWLNDTGQTMTDIASGEAAYEQWQAAVTRWEDTVADFDAKRQVHSDLYQAAVTLGPDELAAWQSQTDRANTIENTIVGLQDQLASASSWAKSTFGLGSLQSMGVLPLIPIAVIVGSIAAVAAVAYALYSYDTQLQQKWDYLNAHPDLTPAQVTAILGSSGGGVMTGVASNLSGLASWIVIGGLVFTLGPILLKQFQKHSKGR